MKSLLLAIMLFTSAFTSLYARVGETLALYDDRYGDAIFRYKDYPYRLCVYNFKGNITRVYFIDNVSVAEQIIMGPYPYDDATSSKLISDSYDFYTSIIRNAYSESSFKESIQYAMIHHFKSDDDGAGNSGVISNITLSKDTFTLHMNINAGTPKQMTFSILIIDKALKNGTDDAKAKFFSFMDSSVQAEKFESQKEKTSGY